MLVEYASRFGPRSLPKRMHPFCVLMAHKHSTGECKSWRGASIAGPSIAGPNKANIGSSRIALAWPDASRLNSAQAKSLPGHLAWAEPSHVSASLGVLVLLVSMRDKDFVVHRCLINMGRFCCWCTASCCFRFAVHDDNLWCCWRLPCELHWFVVFGLVSLLESCCHFRSKFCPMLLTPLVDHVTHPHRRAQDVLAALLEGSCHAVETTRVHKIGSTDRFLGKTFQSSKQSELTDRPSHRECPRKRKRIAPWVR